MSRAFYLLPVALMFLALVSTAAVAGSPSVEFDTDPTVAVCDVTTPEFAAYNPGEKLVEVHIQVSSLIRHGNDEDLIQFLYYFESPELTARVVDYQPQTTLATDVVGSLGIEESDEHSRQLGLNAATNQPGIASGNVSGSAGSRNSQRVQYALLPPLELLAASGTINRGSGVYFKLKPSRRTSLEGASDFVLVLRVPREWQADVLRVRCEAVGHERGAPWEGARERMFGANEFTVALFTEGDEVGRAAAEHFVWSERVLRDTARAHDGEIVDRAYSWFGHRWATELELSEPRIPRYWLEELLHLPADANHDRYAHRLPEAVNAAVAQYADAKRLIYNMSVPASRQLLVETPVTVEEEVVQ